ncbi:MAG: DUF4097 family beta strand repeat protein [Oscillospiraceae bacterium]|nr:DUF4097 family beta strand repeat protein [Oscillospiraceae bacterium]
MDESLKYQINSAVHSLNIRIGAAEVVIKEAEIFSLESNLKYLSVSDDNGILTISEENNTGVTYANAFLTLYIPADTVFDDISIMIGAAKMTTGTLSANNVNLKLGAGDIRIENLSATSQSKIEGGAGKITIENGTLRNLQLKMGTGELNLTASLTGESDLCLGIGETNLTLIGEKSDYTVEIEKGLGNISVDGKDVTDFGVSGNGPNRIIIEGGIGAFHLVFEN